MDKDRIASIFSRVFESESIKIDEAMRNHTSFKVGGPADLLLLPENAEKLSVIIDICNANRIPLFVMGNGTNLIVRDKGIRGVVVKLFNNFNSYTVNEDGIEADAGILLSKLANIALDNGFAGLEFAAGIPGTLGGAVSMNAGAYGGEMKDVIDRTEFMDKTGSIKVLKGDQHEFGYRTSYIQTQGGVAVRSVLKLRKGDKESIKELMDDLNKRRKEKQPLDMPSAGSVFKRPEGYFAGKLIEDCGLKGYKMGGAEVSDKHCGFIVNSGNATADDILSLIKHIQDIVKLKFGVELKTEVKVVGEE